ncbi:hypothetical protein E4U58_000282 [Claviceps cyperi]|nr:hypothetical protein E4U58_000282 [Claviceps cyperi]
MASTVTGQPPPDDPYRPEEQRVLQPGAGPDRSWSWSCSFLSSLPLLAMRQTTLTLDKKMIESRKTDKEDLLMFGLEFELESVVARYLSSKRNMDDMIRGLSHRTDGIVDHARQAQWWGV